MGHKHRGASILAACVLLTPPVAAHAADGRLLLGSSYAALQGPSGSFGLLVSLDSSSSRYVNSARGPLVGISLGTDAGKVEVGYGCLDSAGTPLLGFGIDGRLTLTRTWQEARSTTKTTYAGLEAGLMVSVVRVSLGLGKRIQGPQTARDLVVAWSVGIQLPLDW